MRQMKCLNSQLYFSLFVCVGLLLALLTCPVLLSLAVGTVVSEMYAEGGLARFFRGWQAAYIRGIPGASSTLVTYTYLSRLWDDDGAA